MRLDAYGTTDELNSWLGLIAATAPQGVFGFIETLQSELFSMGSYLALDGEASFQMPKLNPDLVTQMEQQIDAWNQDLPELKNFILPGGSVASAHAQVARTVCRRAERLVIALSQQVEVPAEIPVFLNRLSDFLFVAARFILHTEGRSEVIWTPKY